jgi:hypothetical protein
MPRIDLRARREDAAPALVPSPLFFPVEIHSLGNPIQVGNTAFTNSEMQMIVRTDTNRILGTHGSIYKLVTHETCFNAVNEAIYQSNIDANNIEFKDTSSHQGARAFRYYTCRGNSEIIVPGLTVALELCVMNSYDGTMKFGYIASAKKLGDNHYLTFTNSRVMAFGKHTTNISVPGIVRRLNTVMEDFQAQTEIWREWYRIEVNNHQAGQVFAQLPSSNETVQGTLSTLFRRTSMEYGFNAWSIYKTLAKWASDPDLVRHAHRDNADSIRMEREKRIRKCMGGRRFQELIDV